MELSKTLERIRALIAKADNLESLGDENSLNEAKALRERADDMMQKYAVEEWQLLRDTDTGFKPTRVRIDVGEEGNPFLQELATLVDVVANFCKCSSVWMQGSAYAPAGRMEYCWVYGYESDLRYFELLITTLQLHMTGAIFPKPDTAKTVGQNAYELHNAGLNWYDIAQAYGWVETDSWAGEPKYMYRHRESGERASWGKTVGRIKAAYAAEVKARGERPLRIPPSGSENFRRNAVQGYLHTIRWRLAEIAGKRGPGTELVLADKSQNITAAMDTDFPNRSKTARSRNSFNAGAYARGVRHARTANLNPAAGGAPRKALG